MTKESEKDKALLSLICVCFAFIGNINTGDASTENAIEDGKRLAADIMKDKDFKILWEK